MLDDDPLMQKHAFKKALGVAAIWTAWRYSRTPGYVKYVKVTWLTGFALLVFVFIVIPILVRI